MKKTLLLLAGASVIAGCARTESTQSVATAPSAPVADAPVPVPDRPKPQYGSFGFDTAGMNSEISPGDDFDEYANGLWLKNTPIPADRSNYGMFTKLDDLSKQRTREILEEASNDPNSKIGKAYASYVDEAAANAKGIDPIRPWLTEIKALKSKSGYAALAAKADRMGISTPFGSSIGQDDKNPDQYIFIMSQSGIGLPDRDFYLVENPRFVKVRAAYLKFLENVLTIAGEPNAAARAKAVFEYEKKIATVHWDKEASSDATKTYNKTTVQQLQKDAPGFDFATFIRGIGVNSNDLLYAQPSAFKAMAKIISASDVNILKDALIIRSLSSYSNVLSDTIANENFAFYGTALTGTPQRQPRWKRGVSLVESAMGEEIGKVYVAKYFNQETKSAADELVKNVLGAMGRRIENLSWMQPQTKAKAKKKLDNFTVKIGYPDRWKDYSSLEIKANDLFGNAVRVNEWNHEDGLSKLGVPIRKWEWSMTPMTINAYANFSMNEIVFPAAILQPPFFDPNADPAMNYGGIGAVIGHEVSHHFDDQGAKYDENGKLSDWWTAEDVAAFKAASKKLIEQYNAYEPLPGQKINGEFTLGENIGDLAGLAVAYDAYKASLGGKEAPIIDGTTGDQRFFLGWAQVWRRNYREAELAQRLTTDPHSPAKQRVWVVRNQDVWYDAFKAQPSSKLYLKPEDRVRIW
jgi:putative endopeptidase